MGAAALDPAPSAGVCRDGSDLALQSFGRTIDVAMICRSIRIPGRLSTSGRGSQTSAAGSRRSDTFPRSSAGVPRQPLGVPKRSRSARESSEADRLRSVRVPRHGCTLSAPARKLRSCSCRASQAVPRIPAPFRARSGRFREDLQDFRRSSASFWRSSADLAIRAAMICAAIPRSDSRYREIVTAAFCLLAALRAAPGSLCSVLWRLHVFPGLIFGHPWRLHVVPG